MELDGKTLDELKLIYMDNFGDEVFARELATARSGRGRRAG